MTKYAVMVTDPLTIRYHLERAIYLAKTGRPGPCWLDLPLNIQSAIIETDDLRAYDPKEDEKELMDFADRLEEATIRTIEEGKMTKDLALITTMEDPTVLNSEGFIKAIAENL